MEKPTVWTKDVLTGADLIARFAHGLLTGPCGVAFMRVSALGQGAELNAKLLMDTAEVLAGDAMARSFARCEERNLVALKYGGGDDPALPCHHVSGGQKMDVKNDG